MEVLVVMVVIVIGILVVLRAFPVGFQSLRHAENVSIAGRLAQYEIEKWKNRAANLPSGILPIDPATGLVDLTLRPGPPTDDINSSCFRRVLGEVTRVPVGTYYDTPGSQDIGGMYILAYSPIDVTLDPMGIPTSSSFSVYGGNMRGRIYDSTDADVRPWERMRTRYGIDYAEHKMCFPLPPPGGTYLYHISIAYWTNDSPPVLENYSRDIPITDTDRWMDMFLTGPPANYGKIDEGSENVARGFICLQSAAVWSDDVYEYKLLDPVVGIMAFNPRGYGYQESTEQGTRLLEAHIDYNIKDVHIISEERSVPSSAPPYAIKLTLPFLKEKGQTVMNEGTFYAGLSNGLVLVNLTNALEWKPDVLIVNPADGARIYPRSGDPQFPGMTNVTVDFKTGTVTFPTSTVLAMLPSGPVPDYNISGKTLRFYYEADNDWSIQLLKAYESYNERAYVAPLNLDYDEFMRDGSVGAGDRCRLLFKPCDSEKTVAVTYKWKGQDLQGNPTTTTENGECHQVSGDFVNYGGVDFAYIDLNHNVSEMADIVIVAGVSIKARAVWRESKIWFHTDLDSSLTRRPTEY